MNWAEAVRWLPTAAVAAMAVVAFVAASAQAPRPARKYWIAGVLLCGALALAASAWQQTRSRSALAGETAQLQELGGRLDKLATLLPAKPGKTPGETFDSVTSAILSLNAKVKDLEAQIEVAQEIARRRTIAPDVATKMADWLRQFGSHRVVVSCAPDDVEAFDYANRLATVLREAGWEALGPEKTTIFGEAPAMGVKLFVRAGTEAPDTATILTDAFTRFNIPYQSGLTPSDAIPDPATVELFVSHKS